MTSTIPDDGSLPDDRLPERVRAVLAAHDTLVLATAAPDGQPEAAGVFYAPVIEAGRLLLVTALLAPSHKLAHLRADPRAAVYIGPSEPSRWVQAECIAEEAADEAGRDERLAQLLAAAPGAGVFVERVPIAVVLLAVTRLKLTDLTGEQPPVLTLRLGEGGSGL